MGAIKRKTVLRILRGARDIISDKDKWCQKDMATTGGMAVLPISDLAEKFCTLGAIVSVADEKLVEFQSKRNKTCSRSGAKSKLWFDMGPRAYAAVDRLIEHVPEDDDALTYSAATRSKKTFYPAMYIEYINDKNGHGRRRLVTAMNHAIASLEEELGA